MKPKILCLCAAGNNRSVAAGYLLKHQYRYDAVCAGVHAAAPETLRMLCQWADRILVCGEQTLACKIPGEFAAKVTQLAIGEDRWGPTYHPELLALMKAELARLGLI